MQINRRIVVTGGAGFIGSALCRRLISKRSAVVLNFDKLTYAGSLSSVEEMQMSDLYQFYKVDIADRVAVTEALEKFQPTAIFHLAAESHVDRSITGADPFIQTNIVGTYVMLEVALRYWRSRSEDERLAFRFHHVSTDEVFGSLGSDGSFVENTPYDPRSPYSATKAASDHLVRAWCHTYGLPAVISNCSNNYGPYQFPDKLIPLSIINALKGLPVAVYGNGDNIRDWLYVDDHARALDLIISNGKPGESYNVGAGNERTNLEVVETICDLVDELLPEVGLKRRDLITFVADRPGHDQRYAIDASKLERELGWQAEHGFSAGLRKTVEWYLSNEHWWGPLRDRYDGRRLGFEHPEALLS